MYNPYRQYEDIYGLKQEISELKKEIAECTDDERLFDLREDLADLEERLNFAIQDDEAEEDYRNYRFYAGF